jgi:hypothetical protein
VAWLCAVPVASCRCAAFEGMRNGLMLDMSRQLSSTMNGDSAWTITMKLAVQLPTQVGATFSR